jgi:uncharacterized SAM-binding protein YcdF (DUF218 family)
MNQDSKIRKKSYQGSCTSCSAGVIALSLIAFVGIIGFYFFLRVIGAYLIVADDLEQMDAVVVLSGGGLSRREEGTKLFKEKYAKTFVLTETGETVSDLGVNYSTVLKQEAIQMGIPDDAILITQEHANNTLEEAIAVKKLLENSELISAVVITDPFHTRRARMIFQDVFQDTGIDIKVRPVIGSWYRSDTWFASNRGWEATIQEYLRIIGYKLGLQA